jgi:hypothetical protein
MRRNQRNGDLIRQYLDQLRLSLRIPEVGRILVETEDHLRDAAAAGVAAGLPEAEAQRAAIAAFGPVREIVYAHQTRHGRVAAMLADVALVLWRVAAVYLLAWPVFLVHDLLMEGHVVTVAAVIVCGATETAGLALLAAYFIVRHVRRRSGRVWSVPLGGYFPLIAAIVSGAVAMGMLLLVSSHTVSALVPSIVGLTALGLTASYGWRMGRMLRHSGHDDRGELA